MNIIKSIWRYKNGVSHATFSTTSFSANKTRIFFENDKRAIDIVIDENYNEIYDRMKNKSDPELEYCRKQYYLLRTAHMSVLEENKLLRQNIKTLQDFIENKFT